MLAAFTSAAASEGFAGQVSLAEVLGQPGPDAEEDGMPTVEQLERLDKHARVWHPRNAPAVAVLRWLEPGGLHDDCRAT